ASSSTSSTTTRSHSRRTGRLRTSSSTCTVGCSASSRAARRTPGFRCSSRDSVGESGLVDPGRARAGGGTGGGAALGRGGDRAGDPGPRGTSDAGSTRSLAGRGDRRRVVRGASARRGGAGRRPGVGAGRARRAGGGAGHGLVARVALADPL